MENLFTKKSLLPLVVLIGLGILLLSLPNSTSAASNGDLIRRKNKGAIYLVHKNQKRPILSMDVFKQRHYRWRKVKKLSTSTIRRIPTGPVLAYYNNTLLRGGNKGTIYVMKNSRRKAISSAQLFRTLGYKWRNIRRVKTKHLRKIPYGGKIALGTSKFINVTANKTFWVKEGSRKLAEVSANRLVKIGYKNGLYVVLIPSQKKTLYRNSFIKVQATSGGLVKLPSYDSRWKYNIFRGNVQVRYSNQSKKLWAINELRLESYLKGMIEAGSSTTDKHDDPLTYIKTMATVARSYASYYRQRGGRHSGEPFHLKNSRLGNGSDQVYAGYKAESSNQTNAVNRTKSRVITSSSGNILVTPYSHGGWVYEKSPSTCISHGGYPIPNRTHRCLRSINPSEAGWSNLILWFCRRVKDPHGDRSWRCGTGGNHCVGLSATGAIGYAKNGRDYSWILGHYYQNTRVVDKNYNPYFKVSIYGISP